MFTVGKKAMIMLAGVGWYQQSSNRIKIKLAFWANWTMFALGFFT